MLWLIGTGSMAIEYAKVLKALKVKFLAIGRGKKSAQRFNFITKKEVFEGGLSKFLKTKPLIPNKVINTVNIEELKSLENVKSDYYIKKIFEYFKEFGVKKFEHLDIWHIDKLRKFYFDSLGVNPVPLRYSYTFKEKLNDLKKTFIKMIEKNL